MMPPPALAAEQLGQALGCDLNLLAKLSVDAGDRDALAFGLLEQRFEPVCIQQIDRDAGGFRADGRL
jgi:hypothetical protein